MLKLRLVMIVSFFAGTAVAQQAPAITGISHVIFYADDLPKSQQFYETLLGWYPLSPAAPNSGLRFYANHAQYIELLPAPRQNMDNRLDLIAFATSDAESLRKSLAEKGVSVPATVTVNADGSRSFLVHDPEGNSIEFTQQGSRTPPEPKSAPLRLSTHIMHAGYTVHDRAALDHFYKDQLGFHLYWQGGYKPERTDWVMMQVPNGTDWVEYMLNPPAQLTRSRLGSDNHFSPGVLSVAQLQQALEQRGWKAPDNQNPQVLGVDGKLQLDLRDPDGTRVEFMEFKPVKEPCCSPYTGASPSSERVW